MSARTHVHASHWLSIVLFGVLLSMVTVVCVAQAHRSDTPLNQNVHSRAFGYFIGDMLERRILLPDSVDPNSLSLPEPERVNTWFALRAVRVEQDAPEATWLVLDYQLVNSPEVSRQVQVPPIALSAADANPIDVPAVSIWVAPLIGAEPGQVSALADIRPDRLPGQETVSPVRKLINQWLIGLGLVMFAWLTWWLWRRWRDRIRLPFDQAWADIKRIPQANENPHAWQRLHRAINASAGRVVQGASLSAFLDQSPHFNPVRSRLEQFYQLSNDRFFAASNSDVPFDLIGLSRSLRQIEGSVAT